MNRLPAILLLVCLACSAVPAQYLKIDNGLSSSSYRNKTGLAIIDRKMTGYALNAGLDYLEGKWFYLSSQAGYMQIGGIDRLQPSPGQGYDEDGEFREKKHYIHLNTTLRAFRKDEKGIIALFIGAGPYLNILTGPRRFDNPFFRDFYDVKSYFGGKGEAGFTADIRNFRIGLTGSYLYSITAPAASEALKLRNNNRMFSLSVGYRIAN